MKKKIILYFLSFFLLIAIVPVTNGKYVNNYKGVSGNITFSDFEINTDTFIVTDESKLESDVLWGTQLGGSESDYRLTMLQNVEFSIINTLNTPLLVMFKIEYALSVYRRDIPIQVTNISTHDTLYATFTTNPNANGEISHNDGGMVSWEYVCKPTLDPRLMLTEKGNTNTLVTNEVLMRSFVLEKGESATYAFTATYSGLSWFSDFKVVKFSTTPYNP